MERVKAPPVASRLIESLRNLGYDFHTAVADLIDNSIVASAANVWVDVCAKNGDKPAYIAVVDDGKGMDRDELYEAMRYGSRREYTTDDLGKYGLGLKTASLSQCARVTVYSRPKKAYARAAIYRWDLDHVHKHDDWELLRLDWEELDGWAQKAIAERIGDGNGTAVIWEKLEKDHELLNSKNGEARDRYLARLTREVREHLRVVFHRFLQGAVQGRRRLKITIGEEVIAPCDPFCLSESATQALNIEKLEVREGTDKVIVAPFILPREDEFASSQAHKDAGGARGWNFQQGFYFYRNNRLLQSGGWSRIRKPDEHTKLLRIAVDFPPELDEIFALNITKMRAKIPAELRDDLESKVSKWAQKARSHYDRSPDSGGRGQRPKTSSRREEEKPSAPVLGPLSIEFGSRVNLGSKVDGTSVLTLPETHPLAATLGHVDGQKSEIRAIVAALLVMVENGLKPRGGAWRKLQRHAMKLIKA